MSADTMDNTTTPTDTAKTAANRVFVLGRDGNPLAPCKRKHAWKLIKARRVRKRWYLADDLLAIQLKDRDLTNAEPATLQVRCNTGVKNTGLAVVMTTPDEDRVVFQMEIAHRTDISRRLIERKSHRRRRRGEVWRRKPRFDNRKRPDGWVPPSIDSIVSNQEHTIRRLAGVTNPDQIVVETGKFDTHKILRPGIKGVEYHQGPLYQSNTRAYIAQQWGHRCAYCGAKDWKSSKHFNLDHVVPRSAGGPTNIRNLVWSCRTCNEKKGSRPVEEFLKNKPKVLNTIRTRHGKRPPLAAAGMYAWICKTLVKHLQTTGLTITETTGADTAAARKTHGVPKSHANDAACCGTEHPVTQLRTPLKLKAIGHGRRKQAKALPTKRYMDWRHLPPAERRRRPCPGHAVHPNHVNGIQTGDLAAILRDETWRTGRANVKAGCRRVHIKTAAGKISTSTTHRTRRLAPRTN